MSTKIHQMIAIGALLFLMTMLLLAIRNMAQGGSLDDLPADEIARRVSNG